MEEINYITTGEFCNKLREVGAALLDGKMEEVKIPFTYISATVEPEGAKKITPAYIRQIVGRVVKPKGNASVKVVTDEEGKKSYVISINDKPNRKTITTDDLESLKASWRAKFIAQLLSTQPRITDLQGDELKGAAIALERFAEMLEAMK